MIALLTCCSVRVARTRFVDRYPGDAPTEGPLCDGVIANRDIRLESSLCIPVISSFVCFYFPEADFSLGLSLRLVRIINIFCKKSLKKLILLFT